MLYSQRLEPFHKNGPLSNLLLVPEKDSSAPDAS